MSRADDSAGLPSLADADWLTRPQTREVFAALTAEGAEARAVGGAVRNALMGIPVKDVDIATTALPGEVMRLADRAGLHAVPTGIEHGTVTVVAGKVPFEVTTLRRDIETFGRHAKVTFTTDWREDAMRRDFTMNALYADPDGTVHDPLGGYADLQARRVRFIGDAHQRIREDYLRILRFFRFGAQYGDARAPDAEGLAAAAAEKAGLSLLSGERIRSELMLLLAAPGAVPALRQMRDAGIIDAAARRDGRCRACRAAGGDRAGVEQASGCRAAARGSGAPARATICANACACRPHDGRPAGAGGTPRRRVRSTHRRGRRQGFHLSARSQGVRRWCADRLGALGRRSGRSGAGRSHIACPSAGARRRYRYAVPTSWRSACRWDRPSDASLRALRNGGSAPAIRTMPAACAPNWKSWRAAS